MSLTAILLIILLGLILLLLEIFILPGLVVGIVGILLMITGILMVYSFYSMTIGNYVLSGTIIVCALLTYLSFKYNTWKKVTLNSSITGKVNILDENLIKVGDEGIALSRLAPMGKAQFKDSTVEVQSLDGFIDENSKIIITKIESNKILIKLKK